MPNNWAEWDKEHGRSGGGARSADKLAAQIKSALGATGNKPAPVHGSHGSVVHKTTKADMKRPAPVKGEKDRADSFRTRIRMAEYQRKKTGETVAQHIDRFTPKTEQKVNPHEGGAAAKPRSADELVTDREQRYESARQQAHRATQAADSEQADPAKDRAAAEAHLRAAGLATSEQQRRTHETQARTHVQQARQVESARQQETLGQHDRLANLSDRAEGASAKAERSNTTENHQAASDLHQQAADLANRMGQTQMAQHHQNLAGMHAMVAEGPRERTGRAGDRSMDRGAPAALAAPAKASVPHPDSPAGRRARYEAGAQSANEASDRAKTAHEHEEAARLQREAAAVAPTSGLKISHARLADIHEKSAANQRRITERAAAPKPKPAVHTATYKGQEITRTSPREYTHAAIYPSTQGNGYGATFHGSAAAAAKGSNGQKPIAVVPVTRAEKGSRSADKVVEQASRPKT